MTITFIKRIILSHSQTSCYNMFDLGYLGIEKDFLEQLYYIPSLYTIKREKKSTKRVITRRKRIQQGPFQKEDIVIEHTICRLKKIQNNE